jgi:2',3'-cyclic-nucleotide 2'-phosphodiesterase (5'-nucleotidase family)
MIRKLNVLLIVVLVLTMITPSTAFGKTGDSYSRLFLMHTNDFHGRLQVDANGRGGSANLAGIVNNMRTRYGDENVVLMDAGDVFFAAPAISQLLMGESAIDVYNTMSYDLAVFGNHEFDKGQEVLIERINQSDFPWLGANVVLEGTEWDLPAWAQPYQILDVGKAKNRVRLGVLGLAAEETPDVTLLGTTDGLVFKDLAETILHYYDEIKSQADALIVVAHMGTADSGPYEGLVTVAQTLIDAGKPVDLFIGGHQHQALSAPVYVGPTAIVSAGQYGRNLGMLDVWINKTTKKPSTSPAFPFRA